MLINLTFSGLAPMHDTNGVFLWSTTVQCFRQLKASKNTFQTGFFHFVFGGGDGARAYTGMFFGRPNHLFYARANLLQHSKSRSIIYALK